MSGGQTSNSAKGRDFFYGGAERFKFLVRIATIHRFRFVALQSHPHFLRNAHVCRRTVERVPQGVECAAGQLANTRLLHLARIQRTLLAVRAVGPLDFLFQEMADDFQARLSARGLDFGFGFHDHFHHRQIQLEVHRVELEFSGSFRQQTGVLFLHTVVGFGLFIYFTAELVRSAAKPPTAFSTVQGTFPLSAPVELILNTVPNPVSRHQ